MRVPEALQRPVRYNCRLLLLECNPSAVGSPVPVCHAWACSDRIRQALIAEVWQSHTSLRIHELPSICDADACACAWQESSVCSAQWLPSCRVTIALLFATCMAYCTRQAKTGLCTVEHTKCNHKPDISRLQPGPTLLLKWTVTVANSHTTR